MSKKHPFKSLVHNILCAKFRFLLLGKMMLQKHLEMLMFNLAKYLSKPIHDFLNLDKLYKIPTLSIDKIK